MVASGMVALLLGILVVSANLLHAEEEGSHLGGIKRDPAQLLLLDICKLPSDPGLCRAKQPKFHYNRKKQSCEMFIYGGCGGNQNRFDDENLCLLACGGKRRS